MTEQLATYYPIADKWKRYMETMPSCIKTDSNYARLLNRLESLLDEHRAKDTVCEPDCVCYDLEEIILKEKGL